MFFKRSFPLILCFVLGVLTWIQYYIPHKVSQDYLRISIDGIIIIGAFAFLLGLASVFMAHYGKIKRKADGWGYSIFVFVGIAIGLGTGIWSKGVQITPEGVVTSLGWMYTYMLYPLQGTMFSILAFFVVSSAFRAFRVKSGEALALFIAAILLVFGTVPLGQIVWDKIFFWVPFQMSSAVEWVMEIPNNAARRGILLGVAIGMVAMSLKIIVGIERQYLGGKE